MRLPWRIRRLCKAGLDPDAVVCSSEDVRLFFGRNVWRLQQLFMADVVTELQSAAVTVGGSVPRVIVIGGGLAGMAAAVALEGIRGPGGAGVDVTLIESRKSLGGRASSFEDPQSGEELDNCQHVLLGCCTNLLDFYGRLGVRHLIRFERTIHFRDGAGRRFDLTGMRGCRRRCILDFLLRRLGRSPGLSGLRIRGRCWRCCGWARRERRRKKLVEVSFGQWLDEHHQPASLLAKMYEPILVGALNEDCRLASAEYAIQVFQDAMLANADGYLLGLPTCPLSQLYGKQPCGNVRLGTRVAELKFAGERVTGVMLAGGEELAADAVVLATNHHAVRRWIPSELADRDERFGGLDRLDSVPILGVHLWFDRAVMTDSHAALITGPLQWLFRKDEEGKILHGVISAARDWVGRPKEECLKAFEAQVRKVLPGAAEAKLVHGVIVIEKRATFSPVPGVDRIRPGQSPGERGIQNLYLAGDYTRTGWPATMEGAIRSGYLAAEGLARRMGISKDASFLVPDLKADWPARVLGLGD